MNALAPVAIPCCCPGAERLPAGREVEVARAFKALADPTRVAIVNRLGAHEVCVCDLGEILGITQSAVSQHLAKYKAYGLVTARRENQTLFYRLADRPDVKMLRKATSQHGIPWDLG